MRRKRAFHEVGVDPEFGKKGRGQMGVRLTSYPQIKLDVNDFFQYFKPITI